MPDIYLLTVMYNFGIIPLITFSANYKVKLKIYGMLT